MTTILALGEVLWDCFPDGPRFGGAPANFVCACAELGRSAVRSLLVSAIGTDDLGTRAQQRLHEHGVDTSLLATHSRPTGQVVVELDDHGRASYRFADDPAWDHIPLTPQMLAIAKTADVVQFGTLAQRETESRESRRTIRELVAASSANCWRILDINLRPPFWSPEVIRDSLALANVLKLNDDELPIVAEVLGIRGSESQILDAIQARYSFRMIALTRGAHGSRLLAADGTTSETPSERVQVVDTVGAGDAFTAALTLGLTQGLPLETIHRWASEVAGFVCSRSGATTTFPQEFQLSAIMSHVGRG